VFFSYIFFAVLDVVQSRVVSVLASLPEANSLAPGLGMIKAFVVLAFVLCKFFAFFTAWQLMGLYYARMDNSVPFTLHIFEIILVGGLSLVDLAHISGLLAKVYTSATDIQTHAFCRTAVFGVYLFGSSITLAALSAD
jgi:p-aminobenzoyl-glutamate transporter AbgT